MTSTGALTLWVALAGSAGAVARFVVDGLVRARCATTFPFGTLIINVTGSALLGLLTGLVIFHGGSDTLRVVAGTGFCGGYTTFSTASVETVRLAQQGRCRPAIAAGAGTLLLTTAAAALGLLVANAL